MTSIVIPSLLLNDISKNSSPLGCFDLFVTMNLLYFSIPVGWTSVKNSASALIPESNREKFLLQKTKLLNSKKNWFSSSFRHPWCFGKLSHTVLGSTPRQDPEGSGTFLFLEWSRCSTFFDKKSNSIFPYILNLPAILVKLWLILSNSSLIWVAWLSVLFIFPSKCVTWFKLFCYWYNCILMYNCIHPYLFCSVILLYSQK